MSDAQTVILILLFLGMSLFNFLTTRELFKIQDQLKDVLAQLKEADHD